MSDLVTLILPRGDGWSYPVSHGDRQFHVYRADAANPESDWLVDVPRAAAVHFIHRGGFSLMPTSYVVHSQGTIRMHQPGGSGHCSWGGIAFVPDEHHVVEVPIEAVAELQAHGFEPAPPPGEEAAPEPERKGRRGKGSEQATDTPAHKWEKDPKGEAHPDGVKPEPETVPAA